MARRVLLLATCGAAACSASAGARANESAVVKPTAVEQIERRHADVDLTGTWASGSEGEPVARRLVLRPECNYSPAVWIVEQRGDRVRVWAIPESHAQGVASTEAVSRAAAEGRVSGMIVTIEMAGARYLLRYDSTSGHLRGTLNDEPFWAVRQDIVQPELCIGVP